jgi:RecA-family ATPase
MKNESKTTVPATGADVQRIPAELRQRTQWCYSLPGDKSPRKTSNVLASSTNPNDWMSFELACQWADHYGGHVGYMLQKDDPFTCIDLDVKPGATPEQIANHQAIVNDFDSYSELSRSGLGMHVWTRGNIGTGCRFNGVEVYSQDRYIICTGNVYFDKPIQERQALLDRLVGKMRGPLSARPVLHDGPQIEDDATILDRARRAANAEKFSRLWSADPTGDHPPEYPTPSEADMALVSILAFYSANNDQVRRLFAESARGQRDKYASAKQERKQYLLDRMLTVARARDSRAQGVEHGRQIAEAILASWQRRKALEAASLIFDWDTTPDLPPDLVDGLIADEEVTLLGGHGGIGKGFLSLQLAVAVATGTPVLGHNVEQSRRVLYYSAEDGRKRIGGRLRRLLSSYTDAAKALAKQNLRVVDASEVDPLFGRIANGHVGPLPPYNALQNMISAFDAQMVVIDGASDTFDGTEIVKREVTAFIRSMKRAHPARRIGVLLIVHIDRASARGHSSNDEGYSGNVAWHNACRRRMYLQKKIDRDSETKEETGETITLRVMKNQDGPPAPDMEVLRQDTGFWIPAVQISGSMERGGNYAPTILRLIREYYERGQWISTSLAPQATTGVYQTLKGDPNCPPIGRKRLDDLIRNLERDQQLVREDYRRTNGGKSERWKVPGLRLVT